MHFSAKDSHYNLEGLKPNTFYHVRSKSRNKAGLSDASNIIYLHTSGLNAIPRIGPFPNSSTSVSKPSLDRTFKTIIMAMSLHMIQRRWCVTNRLPSKSFCKRNGTCNFDVIFWGHKSCEEEVRCDYKYLMNGEQLQIENREKLINVNNVLGKYCRAAKCIIHTYITNIHVC